MSFVFISRQLSKHSESESDSEKKKRSASITSPEIRDVRRFSKSGNKRLSKDYSVKKRTSTISGNIGMSSKLIEKEMMEEGSVSKFITICFLTL